MALPATMRRFEIGLSDSDREVYDTLDLRVAQHPSESERYLVARVIARCLEHGEGLEFSKGGVSDDTEPALVQRDLTGRLIGWIEIGSPSPDRLHKATKASPRVCVYTWKDADKLAAEILERKTHRANEIELNELDADVLDALAARLDRVNKWDIAVTGGALYITTSGSGGDASFETAARRVSIG